LVKEKFFLRAKASYKVKSSDWRFERVANAVLGKYRTVVQYKGRINIPRALRALGYRLEQNRFRRLDPKCRPGGPGWSRGCALQSLNIIGGSQSKLDYWWLTKPNLVLGLRLATSPVREGRATADTSEVCHSARST
jgi:hypothetical protein